MRSSHQFCPPTPRVLHRTASSWCPSHPRRTPSAGRRWTRLCCATRHSWRQRAPPPARVSLAPTASAASSSPSSWLTRPWRCLSRRSPTGGVQRWCLLCCASVRAARVLRMSGSCGTATQQVLHPLPACLPCSGLTGGKFLERGKVYKAGNKLVGGGETDGGARQGAGCCRHPGVVPSAPCSRACTDPPTPTVAGVDHRARPLCGRRPGPALPPLPPHRSRRVHPAVHR